MAIDAPKTESRHLKEPLPRVFTLKKGKQRQEVEEEWKEDKVVLSGKKTKRQHNGASRSL